MAWGMPIGHPECEACMTMRPTREHVRGAAALRRLQVVDDLPLPRLRLDYALGAAGAPIGANPRLITSWVIAHPVGCGVADATAQFSASGTPFRVERMASSTPMA